MTPTPQLIRDASEVHKYLGSASFNNAKWPPLKVKDYPKDCGCSCVSHADGYGFSFTPCGDHRGIMHNISTTDFNEISIEPATQKEKN